MPASRFVVRRRNWRWAPGSEHTPRGWVCFPGPGAEVAGFESFDAAEADRTLREAAVRLRMNPFECGPLPAVTTLPDPILRDFLMDAGVEPPAAGVSWADWWTATRPTMPDEQQARVWHAADKVRFFEVTEEPDAPQVHVVVDVTWEERDGVHVAEWDGGELIRACRSLKRAGEIARGRANQRRITLAGQHAVDAAPFADCRPSHVPDPFAPGSTRLLRLPRASFSEVVSIPFDESGDDIIGAGPFPHGTWLNRSERLAVVLRLEYAVGPDGCRRTPLDIGVPISAFADWEKAQEERMRLDRVVRAGLNPFAFACDPDELRQCYGLWGRDLAAALEAVCQVIGVPKCGDGDWASWWSDHVVTLSEGQRELFWRVLNFVQHHSVISVVFEG